MITRVQQESLTKPSMGGDKDTHGLHRLVRAQLRPYPCAASSVLHAPTRHYIQRENQSQEGR
eukprot:6508202-Pyramimonas_sp.AAC.1